MPRRTPDRVAIWEPDPDGHRMVYVRILLDRCRVLGHSALLLTSLAAAHDSQTALHLPADVEVSPCDVRTPSESVKAAVHHGASLLVIPSGDDKLLGLLLSRLPVPTTTLMMARPEWTRSGPFSRARGRRAAKTLVVRMLGLKRNVRILSLAPSAPLERLGQMEVADPVLINRPVHWYHAHRSDFRAARSMASEMTWIGLVGGVSDHKNPQLVMRAVLRAGEHTSQRLGFAILGPISPNVASQVRDMAEILRAARIPVIIDATRRSNETINEDVAALDILVCAYSSHSPNSTTAKAHYLGTKVVGAGSAEFLSNGNAFWTAVSSSLTPSDLSNALYVACSESPPRPSSPPPQEEFADRLLGRR